MKKIFENFKELKNTIFASFSNSWCYDHMEADGNAGFGMCDGDGGTNLGDCKNCPYYTRK